MILKLLLKYGQSSALTNIKWSWSHASIVYLELTWWIRSIINLKLRTAAASIVNLKLWTTTTPIIHLKLRTSIASIIYLKLRTASAPVIYLKLRLLSFIHLKILMSSILLEIRARGWPVINLKTIWRHCSTIFIKFLLCSIEIILLPNRNILRLLKIILFIILAEIVIRSFVHIVGIAKAWFFIKSIILSFRNLLVRISFKNWKLLMLPYRIALLLVRDMKWIIRQWFFQVIIMINIILIILFISLFLHCWSIWYSWIHGALCIIIELIHFHLFCYLLGMHVLWGCLFHFFKFLLVFYFFHYFHSFLWPQCINILCFQNCYFFCLLRLYFFLFS